MRKFPVFIILAANLISVGIACTATSNPPAFTAPSHTKADTEANEYAVYSAVLSDFAKARSPQNTTPLLVIRDQTVWFESDLTGLSYLEQLKNEMPTISEAMIEDYRTKYKQAQQLTNSFDQRTKCVLISMREPAFPESQEIRMKYPDSLGIITLSRVGFDQGMTHALVYLVYNCRGLCGGGSYLLLSKDNVVWTITGKRPIWMS